MTNLHSLNLESVRLPPHTISNLHNQEYLPRHFHCGKTCTLMKPSPLANQIQVTLILMIYKKHRAWHF
jgi:hypothetical protein